MTKSKSNKRHISAIDIFAGTGGIKVGKMSSVKYINTDKFLDRIYEDYVDYSDNCYMIDDESMIDEVNTYAPCVIASAMAYGPTRKIIMSSALKSDNVAQYITYFTRVLTQMQAGTMFSTKSTHDDDIIHVATKVFWMLNNKMDDMYKGSHNTYTK